MKKFAAAILVMACVAVSSNAAHAARGGWYYDDNPGGWEDLRLDDSYRGTTLYLGGTKDWCGLPGASYATMRRVLSNNNGLEIDWWVSHDCGGVLRVCVENVRGQAACSSYVRQ
jgi:hypothetical protein